MQQSRYERERRRQRFIILGGVLVGVVTVVLVVAALLQIFVLDPQRTVATVAGQSITVQELQKRIRYDQLQVTNRYNQLSQQVSQLQSQADPNNAFLLQFYTQQLQQIAQQGSAEQLARNSLDTAIDNLLVRNEAARRGITVSADEVQAQLERDFGFFRQTLTPFPTDTPAPPTATPIPAPTSVTATQPTTAPTPAPTVVLPTPTPRLQPTSITEGDFQMLYQRTVDSYQPLGLSEAEVRALVEANLYRERVQAAFADEAPTNAPHFRFDYLRFNTEADAQKAVERLTSNAIAFPALISETNAITLPSQIGSGSSLDWTSSLQVVDQFGQSIADQLAVKSIGTPTGVITGTDGGFYVLLPLGREDRPLAEDELQGEQQRLFSAWLNQSRENTTLVQRLLDPATIVPAEVRDTARDFVARTIGQ